MKKIIGLMYILLSLFVTSCNDTLNETEEITTTTSDLTFDPYGFQNINVYTLYDQYEYTLNLDYKDSETLAVSIQTDEAALNDFNKLYDRDYKLLPEAYYSLTTEFTLTEPSITSIPITLDVQKIVNEIGVEEAAGYAISLTASTSEDYAINATGGNAIIHISIDEPTIIFTEANLKASVDDTTQVAPLSIHGTFGFDGFDKTKVTTTVNLDKVATYNAENGTDYIELPSTGYVFKDLTEDLENKTLDINIEVDATAGLVAGTTYLLPVDLSSDVYSFMPETVYYVVEIAATPPHYEAEFNLNTIQLVTNDYSATEVKFDLEKTAELLNTTVDELEANIVLYGVNTDEVSFTKTYTAEPPGYWFLDDGNPGSENPDNASLYVEYKGDGIFNVGQYPDKAKAGEKHTVGVAFTYNDLLVRYNITLNIASAINDITVNAPQDNTYAAVAATFDIDAAAAAIGVSTSELKSNMALYCLNATGNIVEGEYTASPPGYWLNDIGDVCLYGTEGTAIYIEYDSDHTFNVGQFPNFTSAGDVYNYTLMIVYDGNLFVSYNITVNII